MSRQSGVVAVGEPHHITQRGNNRQTVFRSDADRIFYLDTLRRKSHDHGLSILGYCLMSNHVHLVATPKHALSLARAIGQTHFIYAQRANRLRRRSGHLWQSRFYSAPLGPDHLIDALLYVDVNPVRARLVAEAEHYNWSSAKAHVINSDPAKLIDVAAWSNAGVDLDWASRLTRATHGRRAAHDLRRAVLGGRPYGSDSFVDSLERSLGRRLRLAKPGRRATAASAALNM